MAMLNKVRDAAIDCLQSAGINAGAAYPHTAVPAGHSVIRVGIVKAADESAGFAGYLGTEYDPERGTRELYGLRCSFGLSLDIYVPLSAEDAAGDCLQLFDRAAGYIGVRSSGLKIHTLRCGEPAPDKTSGMMHLRGEAEGKVLLISENADGEENFSEFVLRGELKV